MGPIHRIPVVAGIAYIERVRQLTPSFTAVLLPEPENRYFRHALAVMVGGQKVGYVAPEVAPHYFDAVRQAGQPVTCAGRRGSRFDRETSGVELLLDFSTVSGQTTG